MDTKVKSVGLSIKQYFNFCILLHLNMWDKIDAVQDIYNWVAIDPTMKTTNLVWTKCTDLFQNLKTDADAITYIYTQVYMYMYYVYLSIWSENCLELH